MSGGRGLALVAAMAVLSAAPAVGGDPESRPICGKDEVWLEERCVTLPKRVKKVEPVYPARALERVESASVTLSAIVQPDGTVTDLKVLKCNRRGYGFEEAAIAAVSKWTYTPAMAEGKPIAMPFTVRVDFSASGSDIQR